MEARYRHAGTRGLIMSRKPFYGAALAHAHAHAEGFAGHWDGAADWLAALARTSGEAPFAFDIGCGDGHLLDALRARGIPGAGLDISPAFVAAARESRRRAGRCG
jgi:SAM-dependent methyltransferase